MPRTATLIVLLIAILTHTANADQVLLKDSSRIIGTVKQLADGKLTVTTEFAGDIHIDISQVTGITTDHPFTTQADTGDRAVGQLEYNPQIGQSVVTDPAGRLNIAIDRITAIWPKGDPSPEQAKQAETLRKLQHPWSASVALGINGQSGNSETTAVNSDTTALRDTGDERLKLQIHTRFGHENGKESANEIIGGVGLEKDVNDKWFTFGNIDMEFDRQENLDLRAKVTVGGGYFVTREDDNELKLRAGIGFQHESFNDGASEDQAIAELGFDLKKQLTPAVRFTHSTTYFPSFDSLNDYRFVTETAGEIPMTADQKWSLRIGIRNTYDGSPASDTDRLDSYYFFNVVRNWLAD